MDWLAIASAGVAGAAAGLGHLVLKGRGASRIVQTLVFGIAFVGFNWLGQTYVVRPHRNRDLVAQVDRSLRDLAVFQELQKHDPRFISSLRAELIADLQKGTPGAKVAGLVRDRLMEAVPRYLPFASDASVLAFFTAVADQVDQVRAVDSGAAFRFLFPVPGEPLDATKYLSQASQERAIKLMAEVVRSGAAREGPPIDRRRAEVLLREVVSSLGPEHSEGIEGFSDLRRTGLNKAKVVGAAVALYRAVLAMPTADAALSLRYMMATSVEPNS